VVLLWSLVTLLSRVMLVQSFYRLPTCRCFGTDPVSRSWYFDDFRLFDVRLVAAKSFSLWRRTVFSRAVPVCPTVRTALAILKHQWVATDKNHVRHREPLPVCCRHQWIFLESTSNSRNMLSKHAQIFGIHYRHTINIYHVPIFGHSEINQLPAVTIQRGMNLVDEHIDGHPYRVVCSNCWSFSHYIGHTVTEIGD